LFMVPNNSGYSRGEYAMIRFIAQSRGKISAGRYTLNTYLWVQLRLTGASQCARTA
jgi:hypothetical protein